MQCAARSWKGVFHGYGDESTRPCSYTNVSLCLWESLSNQLGWGTKPGGAGQCRCSAGSCLTCCARRRLTVAVPVVLVAVSQTFRVEKRYTASLLRTSTRRSWGSAGSAAHGPASQMAMPVLGFHKVVFSRLANASPARGRPRIRLRVSRRLDAKVSRVNQNTSQSGRRRGRWCRWSGR
jgi:hypothetical protein